jgi:hypothetical protein
LAVSVSGALSLVGISSAFNDTSETALSTIRYNAIMLSWASACFIVSLGIIVPAQLLYTSQKIRDILLDKRRTGWRERVVRVAVRIFAWASLGFQIAGLYFIGQSLKIFSSGPVFFARYGLTFVIACVAIVAVIGIKPDPRRLLADTGCCSTGVL